MAEVNSKSEVIADLAEDFVERYRRGERPSVSEYTQKHPELSAEIREFIAALVMVENLAPVSEEIPADASPAPSTHLRQLGDYRIIREVGRGGMGVVYEAEQVSLGRHVALKVLPQHTLLDSKQKHRFAREAKAAARLHHTNIVPVFGVGDEDGLQYYVMQFIQGLGLDAVLEELKRLQADSPTNTPPAAAGLRVQRENVCATDVARSLIAGQFQPTVLIDSSANDAELEDAAAPSISAPVLGPESLRETDRGQPAETDVSGLIPLPGQSSEANAGSQSKSITYWQSVASIGVQVASALAYAHDQGIQHRDIKPSNLLLDLRGTVWVADFGLAKFEDQPNITHTGDILGTLRYMPPEAFAGKADHRGDIYSLGLTLYELLAMRPAFAESNRNRLIRQVSQEVPPRLDKLDLKVPRDLVTIVQKAIEREAGHRYQAASELAEDLRRFIEDEPIHARQISLVERFARWSRRNKGLATALTTIALLLIAVATGSALAAQHFRDLGQIMERALEDETAALKQADAAAKEAENAAKEAERQSVLAKESEARASSNQARAEREMRYARAHQLATEARAALPTAPQRGTLLAIESMETTSRHNEPVIPAARELLYEGLQSIEGEYLATLTSSADEFASSSDGRWLMSATHATNEIVNSDGHFSNGRVLIWDLKSRPTRARKLPDAVGPAAFRSGGRWLFTAGADSRFYAWDFENLESGMPKRHELNPGQVQESRFPDRLVSMAIASNGKTLVAHFVSAGIAVWDLSPLDTGATPADLTATVHKPPSASGFGGISYGYTLHEWLPSTGAAVTNDGRWMVGNALGEVRGRRSMVAQLVDLSSKNAERRFPLDTAFPVRAMALDPRSRWLAVAFREFPVDPRRVPLDYDPTKEKPAARLLNLNSADPAADFIEIAGGFGPIAFSADGSHLAVGGAKGGVLLYSVLDDRLDSAKELDVPANLDGTLFSPDGRWLAGSFSSGRTLVWDLKKNGNSPAIDAEGSLERFSTDSRWLALKKQNELALFDLEADFLQAVPLRGHDAGINRVVINSAGGYVATAGRENAIRLWNLGGPQDFSYPIYLTSKTFAELGPSERGRPVRLIYPRTTPALFSPGGKWLAAFGDNSPIKLWRTEDLGVGARPRTFGSPEDDVIRLVFSADERSCLSTNVDGTVNVWDLDAEGEIQPRTLTARKAPLHGLAISGDARWVVGSRETSAFSGECFVWDLCDYEHDANPITFRAGSARICFGEFLMLLQNSADSGLSISFVPLGETDTSNALALPKGPQTFAAIGGNVMITRTDDELRLWDLSGDYPPTSPHRTFPYPSDSGRWARGEISSDDGWLLATFDVSDQNNPFSEIKHLWSLKAVGGPKLVRTWNEDRHASNAHSFSPDGRWLIRSEQGGLRFWDLSSGSPQETSFAVQLTAILRGGLGAFSGDGRWFAVSGLSHQRKGRITHLWDLQAKDLRTGYTELPESVSISQFSRDGRWFISSSGRITEDVHLMSLDDETLKKLARSLIGSNGDRPILPNQERTPAPDSLPPESAKGPGVRRAFGGFDPEASRAQDIMSIARRDANGAKQEAEMYVNRFDDDGDEELIFPEWSEVQSDLTNADENGDAKLTLGELADYFQFRRAVTEFQQLDQNHNGFWETSEWAAPTAKFAAMDANQDGSVSREEHQARANIQPNPATFHRFDSNGDGELTGNERTQFGRNMKGADANQDDRVTLSEYMQWSAPRLVNSSFRVTDRNDDGVLDRWEICRAHADVRPYDTDGDGRISIAEIVYQDANYFQRRLDAITRELAPDRTPLSKNPLAADLLHQRGVLQTRACRYQEAIAAFEEALKLRREAPSEAGVPAWTTSYRLAKLYRRTGRLEDAIEQVSEVVKSLESLLGKHHPRTTDARRFWFDVCGEAERLEESLAIGSELLETFKQLDQDDLPIFVSRALPIVIQLQEQGHLDAAENYTRQFQQTLASHQKTSDARWGEVNAVLGQILLAKVKTEVPSSATAISGQPEADLIEAESLLTGAIPHLRSQLRASTRQAAIAALIEVYELRNNNTEAARWRKELSDDDPN